MPISESKLQQTCYTWFWNHYPDLRGCLWMNYNNPKNAAHGAVLKGMGLVAGVADMSLLANGKFYGLEFKTPTGRQSKGQIRWAEAIAKQGGYYLIITSFDQFKEFIENVATNRD